MDASSCLRTRALTWRRNEARRSPAALSAAARTHPSSSSRKRMRTIRARDSLATRCASQEIPTSGAVPTRRERLPCYEHSAPAGSGPLPRRGRVSARPRPPGIRVRLAMGVRSSPTSTWTRVRRGMKVSRLRRHTRVGHCVPPGVALAVLPVIAFLGTLGDRRPLAVPPYRRCRCDGAPHSGPIVVGHHLRPATTTSGTPTSEDSVSQYGWSVVGVLCLERRRKFPI